MLSSGDLLPRRHRHAALLGAAAGLVLQPGGLPAGRAAAGTQDGRGGRQMARGRPSAPWQPGQQCSSSVLRSCCDGSARVLLPRVGSRSRSRMVQRQPQQLQVMVWQRSQHTQVRGARVSQDVAVSWQHAAASVKCLSNAPCCSKLLPAPLCCCYCTCSVRVQPAAGAAAWSPTRTKAWCVGALLQQLAAAVGAHHAAAAGSLSPTSPAA